MRSSATENSGYRRFWDRVGQSFPDLSAAESTRYYRWCEQLLFREFLGPVAGLRIFKTDLWDEAKNTRILGWAAGEGAVGFGLDLSLAVAHDAGRRGLAGSSKRLAVADTRAIPFREGAFDAVYSMGTIEHFAETELAISEIHRVLAPGGSAIVGVPNLLDPFLRPLLVAVLYKLGLYSYGYEKAYSRRALRSLLERVGFEIVAETAILFIPGWLRMLDLACHVWLRPLARFTGWMIQPFWWLYRSLPRVRRHGYLLATVVRKPESGAAASAELLHRS